MARPPSPADRTRRCAAALLVALLAATLPAAPAAAESSPRHEPPVDAPIRDPFRPPTSRWGRGNRGLEYDTAPGTPVRATADGVVTFAGDVAGSRHVTVRHADGVRTSYSFLDEVHVLVGQQVRQGDVVGTTAHRLHLGARIGDAYFDPATLFDGAAPTVRLVPFELPLGLGESGERGAIRQLIGGAGSLIGDAAAWLVGEGLDRVGGAVGASVAWVQEHGGALLRTAGHYAVPVVVRAGQGLYRAARHAHRVASQVCTPAGAAVRPPPGRRVAIRVGGLGSTSDDAAIDDLDLAALGYAAADTARFSYRGGTTPGRGTTFAAVAASEYASSDTQADLWTSGRALADLIEAAAAASPGTPIDVLAHSQGGLVARVAVIELHERHGQAWLDAHLGAVVTLGTPHGGADLATGVFALQSLTPTDRALEVGERLTGLDADAPAAVQLAETSDFQRQLEAAWSPHLVELTSIAARGDLVVPVPRTAVGGAAHAVVSVDGIRAHDALPGSAEAAREVALAVAGRPPTCRSFGTAFGDALVGEGISLAEDVLFGVGWAATAARAVPAG